MSDIRVPVIDPAQQAALRQSLLRLREENEADLREAHATLTTLVEDGTRGSASMREVEANAEYMVKDASEIIAQINAALQRMDDGTYGLCLNCQSPIPVERLELRPYGPTCVPCSG